MQAEGDRLTAERIMLHQSQADMNAQLARLKAIQVCTAAFATDASSSHGCHVRKRNKPYRRAQWLY